MNLLVGALAMGLLLSLLALGIFIAFRVLHTLDLTADGAFGVGAALAAALLVRGASPVVATLTGAAAGALAGTVTGVVHTRFRIEVLLVGILASTALYSVMLYVMGGGDLGLTGSPTVFSLAERLRRGVSGGGDQITMGDATVSAESVTSLALLLVLAALVGRAAAWFFGTRRGLAMRAAGENPDMARAQGIDVNETVVLGLALSNGLVALAGALFAQYQGFANVQMGIGNFVTGLACIVLGETVFGGRRVGRQIAAVIGGTVLFRLVVSAALRAGLDPNALKLLTAAFVFAVLVLPRAARRVLAGRA